MNTIIINIMLICIGFLFFLIRSYLKNKYLSFILVVLGAFAWGIFFINTFSMSYKTTLWYFVFILICFITIMIMNKKIVKFFVILNNKNN